jgi:hypothetical protein
VLDVTATGVQFGRFKRVDVETQDGCAGAGKLQGQRQADISKSDDGDFSGRIHWWFDGLQDFD